MFLAPHPYMTMNIAFYIYSIQERVISFLFHTDCFFVVFFAFKQKMKTSIRVRHK